MLGDVLLITEKHQAAGAAIVEVVLTKPVPKMIIAISGESGSGKSELSHVVARGLRSAGYMTKVIHIDNYYRILPLERKEWRLSNGIEKVVGYSEYDWDTLYKNIDAFKTGNTSQMPCVDLVTEQVDQLITDFSSIDMLVIDGLYAIKTDNVDLRFFIDLTYHVTKKAQAIRGKEPQNEYRARVLEQEHKMVQALRSSADYLISPDFELLPNK